MCDASGKTTSDECVIWEWFRRAISTGVAGYFLNASVQGEAAHGLTDPMGAVNTECLEQLERVVCQSRQRVGWRGGRGIAMRLKKTFVECGASGY
jgi:uncharacterized hydantoinase/oxoprolinase family protein